MPVDVTGKAVNVCRQLSKQSTAFMAALEELERVNAQVADSALDITTAANNAAIGQQADLMHAAPADYQAVQASIAAIRTFINGGNHQKVLQKVRF